MARTADYPIQGFLYQFLVTLYKLLESADSSIVTVEGIVEDIDISTPTELVAVQCKYHETKDNYTLSSIYKPVLQMLCHFNANQDKSIKYRLHGHFKNETPNNIKKLAYNELQDILKTKAVNYQTYIRKLSGFANFNKFLDQFEIHFGDTYDNTQLEVKKLLEKEGFTSGEVDDIFFPNAIHQIAEICIKHNVAKRKITKGEFLIKLRNTKSTAISRWTKELKSYHSLLKIRREQLRVNLNANYRVRCLVLDSLFIKKFTSQITLLIEDFINKYHKKIKLNNCPIISISGDEKAINEIWIKLHSRNIIVERGHIAGKFNSSWFLREPMKNYKDVKSEFNVRLCNYQSDFEEFLTDATIHDVFVISNNNDLIQDIHDVNMEQIETAEMNEIRYILSLNNSL